MIFSQADLGSTSGQELFFSFHSESLKLFWWKIVLAASGTKILRRVSLRFIFFWQHRFSISIGLKRFFEKINKTHLSCLYGKKASLHRGAYVQGAII